MLPINVTHCPTVYDQKEFDENERKRYLHSSIVDHPILNTLSLRHLVAKKFSGQKVEQATVVCVATECIYCHQQQQENDYDDSGHTTFTQAGLIHS